jgi:transposase
MKEREGVEGLRLRYQGKEALLKPEQRAAVVEWIKEHETLRVEEVRDYVESHYGVIYQSKQSYYDLLSDGGMSYHHSEAVNPKWDEEQVMQKREEIKKKWHNTTARLSEVK